jgi:hypothetical protein
MKGRRKVFRVRAGMAAVVCVLLVVAIVGAASESRGAVADGTAACVVSAVAFDGSVALHYAKVRAAPGVRPKLANAHPSKCGGNLPSCGGTVEMAAGDDIAIGKTCGDFSYVEHFGKDRVSVGWVPTDSLVPSRMSEPYDDGEPGGRDPPSYVTPWRIHVALKQGKGVPVCEAYVQRLNQSLFHEPPFCGRPENDGVPGFSRVKKVPRTSAEVNALYPQVMNLFGKEGIYTASTGPGLIWRSPSPQMAGVAAEPDPAFMPKSFLSEKERGISDADKVAVWTFEPPLDLDGDGMPDYILVWRGFPPVWNVDHYDDLLTCGIQSGRRVEPVSEAHQYPFVLSQSGKEVDVERTRGLFESPSSVGTDSPTRQGYISESLGFVMYRGRVYLDGTGPIGRPGIDQTDISLYERTGATLRRICLVSNDEPEWKTL